MLSCRQLPPLSELAALPRISGCPIALLAKAPCAAAQANTSPGNSKHATHCCCCLWIWPLRMQVRLLPEPAIRACARDSSALAFMATAATPIDMFSKGSGFQDVQVLELAGKPPHSPLGAYAKSGVTLHCINQHTKSGATPLPSIRAVVYSHPLPEPALWVCARESSASAFLSAAAAAGSCYSHRHVQ